MCKYFNGNLALIPNLLSSPYDEPPLKFPRSANTNPDLRIDGHHKKKISSDLGFPSGRFPSRIILLFRFLEVQQEKSPHGHCIETQHADGILLNGTPRALKTGCPF